MKCEKDYLNFNVVGVKLVAVALNPSHDQVFNEFKVEFKEFSEELELYRDMLEGLSYSVATHNLEIFKTFFAFNLWAFAFDDTVDQNEETTRLWVNIMRERHSRGKKFIDRVFNYCVKLIEYMNEAEQQYYLNTWIEWIEMNGSDKRKNIILGEIDLEYEEYHKIRMIDIGTIPFITLFEIAIKLDLQSINNDEVVKDLYFRFRDKIHEIMYLSNDLYSFKKEIIAKVYKFNLMYLKMKNEAITAQTAADCIVKELNESIKSAEDMGKQLIQIPVERVSECVPIYDKYV